jgi:preprotein translocase subunit SecF
VSTSDLTGKPQGAKRGIFYRLYTGTGAFDIVGKRKRFYIFFGVIILICLASMFVRGFNYSIEFKGGTQIQLPTQGVHGVITQQQAQSVFTSTLGKAPASSVTVGTGNSATIQIRSETLTNAQTQQVETALFNQFQPKGSNGKPNQQAISDSAVSSSWGGQISQQMLIGLIIFLVLVTIFLSVYFERWMALAALLALVNDLIVTAGVYSLVGWEVSPATVIGLLTILGFSLYDAVVVFDKVRENTRGLLGLTRQTFAESANLALNQTLMRSINTSLIALLPVLGLLVVGVGVLGVGTLTDLALVQLVGMLSGALSSLCLATPLLVDFKMSQTAYKQQARRVFARRETLAKRAAERAAAGVDAPSADEDIADEVPGEPGSREERAYAAASGVPARNPKAHQRRGNRPTGKARPGGGKRRH